MAKVYKVDTGIQWVNDMSNLTMRNTVFNILNSFFPNMLKTYDSSSPTKGIVGINASNNGLLFRGYNTSTPNVFNMYAAQNGSQIDTDHCFKLWDDTNFSGKPAIVYMPIKNGVLMGFCGENDDYTKYMTKAFVLRDGHVVFYGLDEKSNTYSVAYSDLTAGQTYFTLVNPLPKAAPVIDSSKICMSKMIIGDSIHDIYVASVAPISPVNAQSFIIDDKEYIAATQKQGYCPAVFRVD